MAIALAKVFQNGMLLQREISAAVWGSALPGEEIRISIQGHTASARADEGGAWAAHLPPLAASASETMRIRGADGEIVLRDIAVGEVFIAGGQSNMEFCMRHEKHLQEALRDCENANIRFYAVPKLAYEGHENDFDYHNVGRWRRATPRDLDYFSAVGYYFARLLERDLSVPVGIIGCNWGGTRTSAWMTEPHARALQPEQCADFDSSLNGQSWPEFIDACHRDPTNDTGYSEWHDPIDPMDAEALAALPVLPRTNPQNAPGALYRHMVQHIAPYAARGVLWYQGESDDDFEGKQYRHRRAVEAVMSDWRAAWSDPVLPFFVVQLPGFAYQLDAASRDYPAIRRCQQEAVDGDPRAWLCSISDAGEEHDIHPKDKRTVGNRLALLAERYIFEKDILADPPRCVSARRDGTAIVLTFDHAGSGLRIMGGALQALDISSEGEPLPHTCEVSGNDLRIALAGNVQAPVDIRFARTNWYRVNLYNDAGIPAIPFEYSV